MQVDENTAKLLNEEARRLQEQAQRILDHTAPAGTLPADPAATVPDGVQVALVAVANVIYLEFSRPIERLSLSTEQTRVMIGRLRDVVNGIEPVRKKRKK